MKITTITYNDPGISWGPAIHFLELWNSAALQHPDVEVEGFCPNWTGREPILPLCFGLHRIAVPDVRLYRQLVYDARIAWQLLTRGRSTDVVYVRLSQFHFFSTWVLRLRSNPVVLECNGLLVDDAVSARRSRLFRRFVAWQERALVRRAQGIISVSQGIADTLRASYGPRGNMLTLKNGVGVQFFGDVPAGAPRPARRTTILYVGTFTSWDGAARIVKLAGQFPDIDFLLVGDGPARREIQERATSNMSFIGQVAYGDLPKHYHAADAGIVLYETQRHQRVQLSSLKTLEYLASGLPVFTTKVPGQEFVADLGCGVLSTEETLVEEFRGFLERLPDFRSAALRQRSTIRREHSWEQVAENTIAFVRQLTRPTTTQADLDAAGGRR
ncbi:MAG: glycosyltransferase [Piscinibacter sp.]|nr:glycosyltransferase [Piscinibacter sp.]